MNVFFAVRSGGLKVLAFDRRSPGSWLVRGRGVRAVESRSVPGAESFSSFFPFLEACRRAA